MGILSCDHFYVWLYRTFQSADWLHGQRLKAIVILMIITALFNLFLTSGKELVSFWIFTITYEGRATRS